MTELNLTDSLFAGTYQPHGFVLNFPRDQVESLLPNRLELAHLRDTAQLFFTVGQQAIGPNLFPLAEVYEEAIFSIPNVRYAKIPEAGEFVYMPLLYVSRLLPIAVNKAYGFPKKLARFKVDENQLEISEIFGSGSVHLRFSDSKVALQRNQFRHLRHPAWDMPAITFVGPQALRSKMHFIEQEMILPSKIDAQFNVAEIPWLGNVKEISALEKDSYGGFKTLQKYRFGIPKPIRRPQDQDSQANPWPPGKRKVAILGGGVGAITAAYALTSLPNWQNHLDITIYQMGWRLGGKGASGRNAKHGQRIEEHGLHVWAGFYDNAFRSFKSCYQDLADAGIDDGVFPSWRDAFTTQSEFIQNEYFNETWYPMAAEWPENDAEPGQAEEYLEAHQYLHMLLTFLRDSFQRAPASVSLESLGVATFDDEHGRLATELLDMTAHLPGFPPIISGIGEAALHEIEDTGLHVAESLFGRILGRHEQHDWASEVQRPFLEGIERMLGHFQSGLNVLYEEIKTDPDALKWFNLIAMGVAAGRGMLAEGVLLNGFEVLDKYDLREFLGKYGAPESALQSAIVRGGYDYVFAFEQGDIEKPSFAAGVAIRGALRVFLTYKGALMWKMNAGMGDTIFTPYYKILKHRGVKFEFFTKVTNLGTNSSDDITHIDIERQANLKPEYASYEPFVRIDDIDCWPSEPDYSQLVEGEELAAQKVNLESHWTAWQGSAERLRLGVDFDDVILGLSLGSFPHVCRELEAHPAWARMVDNVKTVQTLAMQLWMKPSIEELGSPFKDQISTAYVENFSTYADMSHLIPAEKWEAPGPKQIAYFCGVLEDASHIPGASETGFPKSQHDRVKKSAKKWLDENIAYHWPNATLPDGKFDRSLKVDGGVFYRANIDPSERYVLSTPNSVQYRLDADQSGFSNLFLAGDWVNNQINAGCVEAATAAGLKAARALSRQNILITGELKKR